MICSSSVVFFYVGAHGFCRCPSGVIISVNETPEWFCGFENVTRAVGVCSEWVKFQFLVNHRFKADDNLSACWQICILSFY